MYENWQKIDNCKYWYELTESYKNMDKKESESPTGSLRYNKGKPKMSTIPPDFLLGLAEVMTMGEEKYGRYNFAKGNYVSVPYDSCMRHLMAYMSGEKNDNESGQHHLFHAAVNIMMMWLYDENFPEMDDREFKKEK